MNADTSDRGANVASGPATAGADDVVLTVRGLVKAYDEQLALDGMDLEVRAGEIHALLGENGAGKSTLIKAVSGAIRFDAGTIEVGGRAVRPSDPQAGRDLGIAVVHQHGNLVPALTVAENIMLGERLPKRAGVLIDRKRMRREAQEILDQVDLDVSPDALMSDLQPHEAGMVQVAKALRTNARLIILDEPTTAFTPSEVKVLFGRLRSLAADGTAFVYVSHRLAEVLEVATRMTVMRDGKLVGSWARSELDHDGLVARLVGDEQIAHRHVEEAHAKQVLRGEPVLEIRGLRGAGLRGIDLTVHHREVVGVAGLPGNGAEDVMRLLYGMDRIEGGEVVLDGQPVRVTDPASARESGFALIPKERHAQAILPATSILQNTTIASTRRYRSDRLLRWMRHRNERADTARVMADLSVKATGPDQDVSFLSGGNQQKVVLGRWLLRDSRVFLFDDPCAGVDIQSKGEIYRIIGDLADRGVATLVASTEMEELVRVCHRVVVFFDGRIVGELVGDQITEQRILRLSFGPAGGKDNHGHNG